MAVIRVLDRDGKLLAPTTRCDYVRHLLKEGKAKVVGYDPFTIQLLYETANLTNTSIKKGHVNTMTKSKNSKNIVIAMAMVAVLAIASIAAYFTATDSNTNQFTVGNVNIDQTEPTWDELPDTDNDGIPDPAEDITPNNEIPKDPKVTNTGLNDAYIFTAVAVPKKAVKVANTTSGVGGVGASGDTAVNPALDDAAVMTQLFQLNAVKDGSATMTEGTHMLAAIKGKTDNGVSNGLTGTFAVDGKMLPVAGASNANVWTGVDSWDSHWYMLDANAVQSQSTFKAAAFTKDGVNLLDHYNVYVFAYGTNGAMTRVAKEASTVPLFNSVTFANVVNVNDVLGISDEDNIDYDSQLEDKQPQVLVKSFAIQADNIADNDSAEVAPVTVWNILNNQDGAYRALADEMWNLDRGWWADPVDSHDATIN